MRFFSLFLLLFNFIFSQTISLTYKATRDTTLKYWRAFFMGMPKASASVCRKDLNKVVTIIGDPNWKRMPIIFGTDFNNPKNWKIDAFYYPGNLNWCYYFRIHSLSVDTGGILFVTSGSPTLPYGDFKTKITMLQYNWDRDKLDYVREYDYSICACGITVMANDSLCPERSFWVCDSINNRIIKFDYDGNFQAQFIGYLQKLQYREAMIFLS